MSSPCRSGSNYKHHLRGETDHFRALPPRENKSTMTTKRFLRAERTENNYSHTTPEQYFLRANMTTKAMTFKSGLCLLPPRRSGSGSKPSTRILYLSSMFQSQYDYRKTRLDESAAKTRETATSTECRCRKFISQVFAVYRLL